VPDARKSYRPSFHAHTILNFEVAALHAHSDSESGESENASLADLGFAGDDLLR
jgi:hypothetical protein